MIGVQRAHKEQYEAASFFDHTQLSKFMSEKVLMNKSIKKNVRNFYNFIFSKEKLPNVMKLILSFFWTFFLVHRDEIISQH